MTRLGGRPWYPSPSPCWAGASVGVEEDVALAEKVTVAPLAQSAVTDCGEDCAGDSGV